MTNGTQLSMNLGALSGIEKVRPFGHGDRITKHNGNRYVVIERTEAYAEPALVCVSLSTGGEAIVLEREVAYRST